MNVTDARSPMLGFSPLAWDQEHKKLPGRVLDVVTSGFLGLTRRQRTQMMTYMFSKWLLLDVSSELNGLYVPNNFLPLVGQAMKALKENNKQNLIHDASRCFGDLHPETNQPRMPIGRMPFGLISYNFFIILCL